MRLMTTMTALIGTAAILALTSAFTRIDRPGR